MCGEKDRQIRELLSKCQRGKSRHSHTGDSSLVDLASIHMLVSDIKPLTFMFKLHEVKVLSKLVIVFVVVHSYLDVYCDTRVRICH